MVKGMISQGIIEQRRSVDEERVIGEVAAPSESERVQFPDNRQYGH